MSDTDDPAVTGPPGDTEGTAPEAPARRRALMLGAIGAASIVSIRPALAATAGSILNCQIPVPDSANRGRFIAADGALVPPGTRGAYAPAPRPYTGEEVKRSFDTGANLPWTDENRSRAYLNYIRRLQRGTSGFTCYASLQMPR